MRARALVQWAAGTAALGFAAVIGCSNNPSACSAPASGNFSVALKYAQTIPVDLFCDAGDIDAGGCGAGPHSLDGASLRIAVSGSTGTVTTGTATWHCTALMPRSAPVTAPDGSTEPGTGCDLALECGQQTVGDASTASLQIQILGPATPTTTDALVLVHEVGPTCCTDEYTGTWH